MTLWRNEVRQPGPARLRPFQQGHLDSLCGLYAAVNAIWFVAKPRGQPMRRNQARVLFRRGITHLRDRGRLAKAIKDGMPPKWLWQLTKDLAHCARRLTGVEVTVSRPTPVSKPFTRQALLQILDTALDSEATRAGRTVVIAGLENTYSHYTVMWGRIGSNYMLFDSDRLKWIHRESLGAPSGRTKRRHQVQRKAVLIVSALQENL
jgi:hypothetical protein